MDPDAELDAQSQRMLSEFDTPEKISTMMKDKFKPLTEGRPMPPLSREGWDGGRARTEGVGDLLIREA
eukprot:6079071-Pyramimonas_sp.AAC.1